MRTTVLAWTAVAAVAFLAAPLPAAAQIYESVGTRAQGMGGAFVAVADDATATWWNPAGLASGSLFSMVLEHGRVDQPPGRAPGGPGWRSRTYGFSAMFPALALSYYRLRVSEIATFSSTEDSVLDRQDQEAGRLPVRSRAISQYGATVGQSIGQHLVVASTFKLVRGGQAASVTTVVDDPFEQADGLDVRRETRVDLDIGAMASLGSVRLGISVKNMREPEFGDGVDRLRLRRQARAGGAFTIEKQGGVFTASFDSDLTRTRTAVGDMRHVAAGVEAWVLQRRLGLRGGVSANTAGIAGRSVSGGLSIGLTRSLFLNGSATAGSDQSRRGWSLGLSTAY
jgi:hypothetical protein